MIRVLLIEDSMSSRERLAERLHQVDDIAVVGRIDVDDAVTLAASFRPDIVLVHTDYMVSQILPIVTELKARIPGCGFGWPTTLPANGCCTGESRGARRRNG